MTWRTELWSTNVTEADEARKDADEWARSFCAVQVQRDEARGAMAAQNKRMEAAGKKCGVPFEVFGCDWPDRVAEELVDVADERNAARKSKLKLQNERDEAREALRAINALAQKSFSLPRGRMLSALIRIEEMSFSATKEAA